MSTQSVQIVTFDYGASLSNVTLRNESTDVLVATADSCPEIGTDAGVYVAAFGEGSVIAAGDYRLRAVIDGAPLNRYVTLTGVDGEVAISRLERTAALGSATIAAVQSGLATAASIVTLRGADSDTLKTLSDQIDGLSSGNTDWTADERAAIRSILGIPGSGTTPADPSVGILDTTRDLVVAYIAAALATVNGTSGTIVGFPTTLNIGDSYTDEANASIHVFIRDASDDPITAVGDFEFTDTEFAPEVTVTQSGSAGRVKAVVTYVDPGAPESYLKIEIPSSQSRRASPGTATIQCLLKWVDTEGKVLCQKTLSSQAVTWNEMV